MKPLYLREDTERQRERLAATARHLHRSGWMPGTSGSVSLRSGDAVLITAHDLDKGRMDARDTVLIDPSEGLPLLGETEWPCAETPVHLALHGYLPDCETVVHVRAAGVTTPAALARGAGHAGPPAAERNLRSGPAGSTPTMLPALPARPDPGRTADEVRAALDGTAAGAPAALLVADTCVFTWGRDLGEALAALDGIEERSRSPLRPGADAPDPAGWTR
ncbi:methylthioribulose-1-phosphate dehydratase [Streptomyces sp. 1222.5]|uniref:class II aldolase/adducin family protein n=1 Tax=unclassified Streptomyces TaxID=2593676 RepID=UPI000894F14B|nr:MULTISPECIES: class II aldolase/adducin family protein [unclassified Streptomyces]PKW10862.1 methylthioribulose-1-phosphate dehydratase [Streptomyces sp. 5112.2]SEB94552.1 methylthioribulose-1-phosphate dehydratase [Streptomyces sp. 1222.5]